MANPFSNLSTGEKVAVGAGGLVVVWFAYKQHQSSAGTSTSASAIDPLTGLPTSQDNQPDPLTGEAYLAEAQQYGSVSAAEQALSGTGLTSPYGYGYGATGLVGTSTGQSLVPQNTVQGTVYASNAAWAQAVEAGLTDIGYSPTDIAAALGRYLGSLSLTSAQQSIVQAAIAEYGPPPVGTFQVIQQPVTQPVVTGNPVPNVVHLEAAQALQVLSSAGFKASGVPAPVQGIIHYVSAQSPAAGSKANAGSTVKLTVGTGVPNVVGKEQAQAYQMIEHAGLHPSGPAPVRGKTHIVTSQSPAAGTVVRPGSTVTVHSKTV